VVHLIKMNKISRIFLILSYSLIVIILIADTPLFLSILDIKDIPIRTLFDTNDIGVYFQSSGWIIGKGKLYTEVASEYPLAANFLFGFCRLISNIFKDVNPFYAFAIVWSLFGLTAWLYTTKIVNEIVGNNQIIKICWLLPATIYFSVFRYDIFPTLFFILSIWSLKENKLIKSALFLGITIALKGYALFTIPSFFFFLNYNFGFKKTIRFILISILPLIILNFSTFLFLGKDALVAPYEFHLVRKFNGQSTWDTLNLQFLVRKLPFLPTFLMIITSMLGFLRKPRNISELAESSLLAITGFVSSLIFYSPQFCLWILSAATFIRNKRILFLTCTLCFFSYIYFPITFDMQYTHKINLFIYEMVILIVSILRIFLIFDLISGIKFNKLKFKNLFYK